MDAWIDSWLVFSRELLILFRLVLAIILGFVLGIERELYKRPAGLRTHILVCTASCLIMLISIYGFDSGDPARLAAQVISGIGFLGAGAIIREGKGITGITTAATIWMSAMIGLACGNGFYFGAILATVCSLGSLTLFRGLEAKMPASNKYRSKVSLVVGYDVNLTDGINSFLMECNLKISNMDVKQIQVDNNKALRIVLIFEKDSDLDSLYSFVRKVEKEYEPIELKLSHE